MFGDLKLAIERAELNVGGHNLLDEAHPNSALRPGLGEELIAGGFCLLAIEAPKIRIPGSGEAEGTYGEGADGA